MRRILLMLMVAALMAAMAAPPAFADDIIMSDKGTWCCTYDVGNDGCSDLDFTWCGLSGDKSGQGPYSTYCTDMAKETTHDTRAHCSEDDLGDWNEPDMTTRPA